jgi:HEAT repeat protein
MMLTRAPLAAALVIAAALALAPESISARTDQNQTWLDVMRSLHDRRADTRLKALETLNLAGYTPAADAVASLIADPDANVRFAAIDAELTFHLNEPIGVPFTDGKTPKHSRAQDAFDAGPLVRNGAIAPASVIDALVHALNDPAPRIRFDALHALGVIAEAPVAVDAASAIAAGLDAADPTTRIATARVLGRLRIASAGAKLIAALNDSNELEQKYATEALGLLHEQRVVASLLERLGYFKSGDMAAETLLALARIAHPSARDTLRAHMNDGDAAMRSAALEGLGRLKDDGSRDVFVARRQKDGSPSVRLAAAFALGCLDAPDIPTLTRALTSAETYGQAVDYLLEIGPAARVGVETVLNATRDSAPRADLIHLLGFIGTKDTVPTIEPFLKDKNERVAHAATDAIARLSR